MTSPYFGLPSDSWLAKTNELIAKLPLTETEVVETVLSCWEGIFSSAIGKQGYKIGAKILPTPQVMGALLHALIPLELARKRKGIWRADQVKSDKDLVCIVDPTLSIEIKTSSHKTQVAGNRSYAQKQAKPASTKPTKEKSGYYLTVNFEKFSFDKASQKVNKPKITQISLGWIDHDDWKGQAAATGQSASISTDVYKYKLKRLYHKGK